MKRLLCLAAACALLAAVPLSHSLLAQQGGGQTKVDLCHIDEEGVGIYITVGEPAVQAHLDHGDCLLADSIEDPTGVGDCVCVAAE